MSGKMTITGWLRRDHVCLRKMLDDIELCLKDESPAGLRKLSDELHRLIAALDAHEKVEMTKLYPTLKEAGGLASSVLHVFESGHTEIHEKLKALNEAISVGPTSLGRIVAGIDLIHVLKEHMLEEEQVLFPVAEERIREEELERLAREIKVA
jgi:iron-sulfur cluster repair protein YtfE (RIC family)